MIVVQIDLALAQHNARRAAAGLGRETAQDIAARVGVTPENLSKLRNGRFSAIRRETLDGLCRELACQPGDLLRWVADGNHGGHGNEPPRSE